VPDEVHEFRRKIGMDFGKIDFVVREGRAVILDVNPTPSVSTEGGSRGAARRAPLLAEALERWVAC
jgi:glutathione synthase/RimK-type ligase-like ATP-grasp enzyme